MIIVVQSFSQTRLFAAPLTASLSFSISQSLRKLILSRWWHPTISSSVVTFSSCLQSSSALRVFSSEPTLCIRWPKYWSISFSTSPSNEYSGLMSFRIDWFGCLDYSWPHCWVAQSSQVGTWNEPTDIAMENEYVKVLAMVISGWWTSGWISFSFKYFLNFFQKYMLVLT